MTSTRDPSGIRELAVCPRIAFYNVSIDALGCVYRTMWFDAMESKLTLAGHASVASFSLRCGATGDTILYNASGPLRKLDAGCFGGRLIRNGTK